MPLLQKARTCQKNVGNAVVVSRNDKLKNRILKDQMQKHTHLVQTGEELTA